MEENELNKLPTKVNWAAIACLHAKRFWWKLGGQMRNGVGFTEEEKLKALIEATKINASYPNQPSLEDRRKFFESVKSKYDKYHRQFYCFVCGKLAECRHHIIPLYCGGVNNYRNIVYLCNHCHSKVHPWLADK